jgi:arabinofuranosyltransferase
MDTALLFLPALGFASWRMRSRPALWSVALGSLPFVLWELFSLVYYGFLFPNTAYAKLEHGIGADEVLMQGLHYFGNTLRWDPLTLPLIAAGCLIPVMARAWPLYPFVVGNLLYLAYVATIGGDFMMGRFFTAPLYVAVLLLSRFSAPTRVRTAAAFVAVAVLASLAPHPSWTTGKEFGVERSHWKDDHWIVDERQIFFRGSGLLRKRKGGSDPAHRWVRQGKKLRESPPQKAVAQYGAVGMRGFYAGPDVHLIDPFGLGDPLLARMPAIHSENWRIAHFQRVVPAGYLQGVRSGENTLVDPGLARYYDKLLVITRGPLFSSERWKAIWGIHVGSYDAWIDRQRYRFPTQRASDELFERESSMP